MRLRLEPETSARSGKSTESEGCPRAGGFVGKQRVVHVGQVPIRCDLVKPTTTMISSEAVRNQQEDRYARASRKPLRNTPPGSPQH